MSVSTPWNKSASSDAKLNRMTIPTDTGANLAALDKTKHKIVVCSSTGSGFTLDHAYLFTEDGTTAIDLGLVSSHKHIDSTTGGSFFDIYAWNHLTLDLQLTKTNDLKKAQWIEAVTSTGTIEDATDGTTGERSIRLRTNGTSGASAQISYPHLKLNFAFPALFNTKIRIEDASSLAFHIGVGADDITAADSNTRKFQAEVCTATNNNYWLRTANGSANSASDSGLAMGTSRTKVDLEHAPTLGTPSDYIYVGGTAFTKTTNIATSGSTADNNIIKHSIKNSTAADRPIHIYGSRLVYRTNDTWGH